MQKIIAYVLIAQMQNMCPRYIAVSFELLYEHGKQCYMACIDTSYSSNVMKYRNLK